MGSYTIKLTKGTFVASVLEHKLREPFYADHDSCWLAILYPDGTCRLNEVDCGPEPSAFVGSDPKDEIDVNKMIGAITEVLDRAKTDLGFTAPELYDWRWDLIKSQVCAAVFAALEVNND